MRAGAHVRIEKPPAASSTQVQEMLQVSAETGKFVGVGFKKMFFPAHTKAREIIERPEFGSVTSITARYPQTLPPVEQRSDDRKMMRFLDHIVHPYSTLRYLGGPIESVYVERNPHSGPSVTIIRFVSGAVGCLHLPSASGHAPVERTEIVGENASIVVDNNIRVTYYRGGSGPKGGYGRAPSYYGDDDSAPLHWEPEFSLGQLYKEGIFVLGYAPEIRYFSECVLNNQPPQVGNLDDAFELLKVYEAYRKPDGARVVINVPQS
jgi:predicted dehydrogenase